jgi:uncharacterized protein (DUF2147 family)
MEPAMKTTFYFAAAAAALLMASSAAQAGGMSFNIDGQKIRIEAPRNCNSLSCISVTNNGSAVNMKDISSVGRKSDDEAATSSQPPVPPAPIPAAANNMSPAVAPAGDASSEHVSGLSSPPPARATSTVAEQLAQLKKLDEAAAPAPVTVASAAPSAPPVQQEAAAAATSPLGLWQTEDGNVRVEQCGANLCGYGDKDGKKSNELVLINMKPSSDNSKWTGRIHNPNSGKDYDATIALKGSDTLRVQGCLLGGALCGGTNWKRVS